MSIGEKSPTWPGVGFLKYLKVTETCADSQGKFDYAEDDEIQVDTCPLVICWMCMHMAITIAPRAKGWNVAENQLGIKAKRYKRQYCGKSYTQYLNHIGLTKYQRCNAGLNDAISRKCANGAGFKKIGEKHRISTGTFCKSIDYEILWKQGIIAALRKKWENLNAKQRQLQQDAFDVHPTIETAHAFKSLLSIKEKKKRVRVLLSAKLNSRCCMTHRKFSRSRVAR